MLDLHLQKSYKNYQQSVQGDRLVCVYVCVSVCLWNVFTVITHYIIIIIMDVTGDITEVIAIYITGPFCITKAMIVYAIKLVKVNRSRLFHHYWPIHL